MNNFGGLTVAADTPIYNYVTEVIRAVGQPDFKEKLAALAEEGARHIVATADLNAAIAATGWAGRLAFWEKELEAREYAVRVGNAAMQDRADALSKL
jgi:hypothetical protein